MADATAVEASVDPVHADTPKFRTSATGKPKLPPVLVPIWAARTPIGIACAGPAEMPKRPTTVFCGSVGGNCGVCATVGKIDRAAQRAKNEPAVAAIFFMAPRCANLRPRQRTKGGRHVADDLTYSA